MRNFFNIIIAIVLSIGGSYLLLNKPASFGAYNPTGGGTYRLQSSIGGSDTSLTLTSFKEPVSNIAYTMSYLNSSIEYATIEPQSTSKEFISFTGITQNSDGTATLTGITRGLGFSYPYTASSTLQQAHSGQSILILSNPPQYSNQFLTLANAATSTNTLVFSSTTPPHYDFTAAQGTGTYISTTSELASIDYVNKTTLSGAANGTNSVKGIYQSATGAQAAAGTALGSTGASLVITSSISSSTPSSPQSVSANTNIVSNASGFINQAWLDLTANWTFTGALSIAASSVKNLTLNSIAYSFPASQTASSTALTTNGSGVLSWEPVPVLLSSTTTTAAMKIASTTTFAAFNNLTIIFNQPSAAANSGQLQMHFNNDSGSNYPWSATATFGQPGWSGNAQGTQAFLLNDINAVGTTSPTYVKADVINELANPKIVQWKTNSYSSGSTYPGFVTGYGQWNNTSEQITQVIFTQSGAAGIPSGTSIRVYGQN